MDRHHLHHRAGVRPGGPRSGAGIGHDAGLGGGLVRHPVRHEHPDLFPQSALRSGLFLAEVRGAQGRDSAGNLHQRAAVHLPADHRHAAGHVLPADRPVDAPGVELGLVEVT